MVFATSAMPCWGKKSTKIDPKSITKQLSNQHPNLHRFWSQFGSIFGGVWGPRWDQIASKIDLKIHQKIDHISDRSWDRFWLILGPNLEPKTAQDPILKASWSHLGAKKWKNPTKMGPKLITFNHHEPKYLQSHPRTPPWTSFSLIFDRFLILFSSIFVWFFFDFWSQAGSSYYSLPQRSGPAMTRRRRLQYG